MKISYLITCSTETKTLERLIKRLSDTLQIWNDINKRNDEVVIVYDEEGGSKETWKIIEMLGFDHIPTWLNLKILKHPLNANYGEHKNWGTKQCSGDYIFQIDGDECPSENIIGENLCLIIESNPDVELIYVPRINDYKGVTEEHARQWGWRLTPSPSCENRPVVNWPDFQSRIYKNNPEKIKWDRKLHEKIVGHDKYSFLPAEEEYTLYHDKTIEKQLETNYRYNKVFSKEENMGHKVT